ncbi:MAG: FAD-dependent oxidoreductase [Candidatus Omnitrophica bacterium]|nr:FAD-dependent oxidoreductase [Candidatus Omnitrophota bacterium]
MDYLIIGSSAAGVSAVEAIRKIDTEAAITVMTEDQVPLYSRLLLSYFLAGVVNEGNIYFKARDFFEKNNIKVMAGTRADVISVKEKVVTTREGHSVGFNKLLIATGARSRQGRIPGFERHDIFTFDTLKDVKAIEAKLKKTRSAVVIGSGLIGLRATYALNARGIIVKLVESKEGIFPQLLDKKMGSLIEKNIEKKGIEIIKGAAVSEILGEEAVEGVQLTNGKRLDCQLVIISDVLEPNIKLATAAGVMSETGILVDGCFKTSLADIFAAGNAVETKEGGVFNYTWPCALEQGRIAGENMAGRKAVYEALSVINYIEFFGVPVVSIGIVRPSAAGYETEEFSDEAAGVYKKVIMRNGIIKGFLGVGKIAHPEAYRSLIKDNVEIGRIRGSIFKEDFSYAN